MTRYRITVTDTGTETKVKGRVWEQGVDPENKPDGYGYTPEIEKVVDYSRTIFEQNRDDLDLVAVIKAVNGIE